MVHPKVNKNFTRLNEMGMRLFGLSRLGLDHFGLGTFCLDNEILQKSYMFTF